ncbi:MAG: 30S ribosomal protein S20 [Pirellulaceae bacterium]|nr:30S ribosomal protein S20 [Planctomycetales bacterium]
MPNTESAKKRLRQNTVRRDRNRATKSLLRRLIRNVLQAVAKGDLAKADDAYKAAAKQLDRAGASNVIHKNKASRLKSRLQHRIKKAKTKSA